MAKKADQALQRRYQFFRDPHNREWGAVVEISTGHPLGAWSPRFEAPLRPDAKFLSIDDRRPGRIQIRYDDWLQERREARKAYVDKCKRYGFNKFGALFDPTRIFDPSASFYEDVRDYAGPPPKPVEPVLAAKQGNRWVLGLLNPDGSVPLMPEKLAPHFVTAPDPVESFGDEYAEPAESIVDDPPAATMRTVSYATKRDEAEVPVKRGPGRPRKNPAPEPATDPWSDAQEG